MKTWLWRLMISLAVLFLMETVFLKMAWLLLVYMASGQQINALTALGISSVHCQNARRREPTVTSDPQLLVVLKLNSTM